MKFRWRLVTRYVVLIATLVGFVLVISGALSVYFFSQENRTHIASLQHEKAVSAAARIALYIKEIEHQMSWTALPQIGSVASPLDQRRYEYLKLLRQVPAITDVAWVDAAGKEKLRISRLTMDVVDASGHQADKKLFQLVNADKAYYSRVYFRQETEPYLTIARSAGGDNGGVTVAEVNLKFVWDVISQIKIGKDGLAFVVDSTGTLIAHPDISLVLKKIDLTRLPQVAALFEPRVTVKDSEGHTAQNLNGKEVLTAHASIPGLNWNVFVELPVEEAYQPLYASILRSLILLMGGVVLSVVASMLLARHMVRPIRAIAEGARQIGAGRLDHRIEVHTGDELELLASRFNAMADQIRNSYADLEEMVEQRTHALTDKNHALNQALEHLAKTQHQLMNTVEELTRHEAIANSASLAKSRFLAAASHDLRQPMHALNLYLGVLAAVPLSEDARSLLANLRQCAQTMDDLFDALLDISRLDANVVQPRMKVYAVATLLECIKMEFLPQARAKGLELRVAGCAALVRSDPALVERIVRNLVSNAVHHTAHGRILVGCHRRGNVLRIAVYDTGPGIAIDDQTLVFEEFYQVGNPERDRTKGLGLGLAIVRRLALLLGGPVTLKSQVGRGSVFAVDLPLVRPEDRVGADPDSMPPTRVVSLDGTLVVVVDDEKMILEAAGVLLQQWGCVVVTATSGALAIQQLAESHRAPDLLICDYRLRGNENGIEVVEAIRDEFNQDIPALLVTGDTSGGNIELIRSHGLIVLHKPVPDGVLRNALSQLLTPQSEGVALSG